MTKFKELGVNKELCKAIEELGFKKPTEVQKESIPFLLTENEDLTALAQTGTGKTAAFGLPAIQQVDVENKNVQVIILCPTRELCVLPKIGTLRVDFEGQEYYLAQDREVLAVIKDKN